MQTKVPKRIKLIVTDLSPCLGYANHKSMYLAMLRKFLEEKPYANKKGFTWIRKTDFINENLVTLNVLVPDSAQDVPEAVKRELRELEPQASLSVFLLTAVLWWLGKHSRLPDDIDQTFPSLATCGESI